MARTESLTTESHCVRLCRRLEAHEATVAVIGLGYVGLPVALILARQDFPVIGFDIDPEKVARVNAGETYIRHIPQDAVATARQAGRLAATGDFARLAEADAIIICVPTPLGEHREPDLSFIAKTAQTIAATLRPGQLVVLESTTYPGTTREVVLPILAATGLHCGEDFFLGFSPEREDPVNASFSLDRIPKVVSGVTANCLEATKALYRDLVAEVVPVSSPEVAESAKLLENIYRCVNIALVNELKLVLDRMGIDIWEVVAAASTKPFGFVPFYPGPGVGGHCIPVDPFYLTWRAREFGLSTRFIELAGEVNAAMPAYVVSRVAAALGTAGKALRGAQVMLLGIAYKKDVDDLRESPALEVLHLLQREGAMVSYHDPFVPRVPALRRFQFDLSSVPLDTHSLRRADCVVVTTDHSAFDPAFIAQHARLIVDTRNLFGALHGVNPRLFRA